MLTPDYRSIRTIVVLFAVLLINTSTANAQTNAPPSTADKPATNPGNGAAQPNQNAQSKPTPTPFPLSVKAVRVNGASAGLNDTITITVDNLDKEIARQQEFGIPQEQRIDPTKYVLFLDDIEMKKLHPTLGPNQELNFKLRRDSDSRDAWLNFLGHPSSSTKQVSASVGMEGKPPLAGKPLTLRLYNQKLLYLATALFIAALIGFIIAAKTTTIIRDSGPPKPINGPLTRPYSLGRAQMAWWFFIILGSFLFIALVTWDLDTITSSSLVLMGIGTGTALGAAMVDANKRQSSNNDLHTLKPKEAQLDASITDLESKIADAKTKLKAGEDDILKTNLAAWQVELATKQEELQQVKAQLEDAVSEQQKPISEGPILDFLSDVNGVTFHRFQIMVWTIVLGLVFLYSVWTSLSMPQFSDTVLALMGISAGTYIGFKIPERQTDANDAAAVAAGG